MTSHHRRDFLRKSAGALGAASAVSLLPPSIRKALAVEAAVESGTLQDVKHIVILMQENRSFDHYFGAMKGVRGFGDRFPIPLASGKPVWYESNGTREIAPFHLKGDATNAALIISTPHNFPDSQAAWGQGRFGEWARYKTDISMGYYLRDEAPFQWALAEAFTICDGYHCSIQTGTDPNRITFWSGSNHDPERRARGLDSDQSNAEAVNLRCWITGAFPAPGYTYYGSSFTWKTIPEVLQDAGISWRIYQDPNDNWQGAMNGALAFKGFREAKPGSPIYENGLKQWTLADLKNDVINGTLPAVSWVCPSQLQSEHPGAPSSPERGGFFTQQVLEALTAKTETWSKTVLFVTFDENDGLFDHLPPPAIPSINIDGTPAGKSTVDVTGLYYQDPGVPYKDILYERFGLPPEKATYPMLTPTDTVSGSRRPWGLGPRVPMYIVSPWSKGGWVDSQVFDHTSVGMFLEKRFGIRVDSISAWHRAVCGDLTSAFDFKTPNDPKWPTLPDMSNYAAIEAAQKLLPAPAAPATPQPLFQETGTRFSRALPYELHTSARVGSRGQLQLIFANTGAQGAVFHVYDKLHLDRIPRRYTVEAGKQLSDDWDTGATDSGKYELWVYGTNGFMRSFKGDALAADTAAFKPEAQVCYEPANGQVYLKVRNGGTAAGKVAVKSNAYRTDGPWSLDVAAGDTGTLHWNLDDSGHWYDFTVSADGIERRFAGRVETGKPSVSDPAMALHLKA